MRRRLPQLALQKLIPCLFAAFFIDALQPLQDGIINLCHFVSLFLLAGGTVDVLPIGVSPVGVPPVGGLVVGVPPVGVPLLYLVAD